MGCCGGKSKKRVTVVSSLPKREKPVVDRDALLRLQKRTPAGVGVPPKKDPNDKPGNRIQELSPELFGSSLCSACQDAKRLMNYWGCDKSEKNVDRLVSLFLRSTSKADDPAVVALTEDDVRQLVLAAISWERESLPPPPPEPTARPVQRRAVAVDDLRVVTFHFNFAGYRSLAATWDRWRESMGSLPVTCIELVIGDDEPEIPGSVVLRGDERYVLWQKEAMINLAMERVKEKYIAWIDHDFLIHDTRWPEKSVELIGDRPVAVQPWGECQYLNRHGGVDRRRPSASALLARGEYPGTGPGAAWMARTSDLRDIGGLYDRNIHGGGDLIWLHALSGSRVDYLNRQSPKAREHQERWIAQLNGRIALESLSSTATHLWHGEFKDRQYISRDKIMRVHDYDPELHVEKDEQGLLRWTKDAPEGLREDIRKYFIGRYEDG